MTDKENAFILKLKPLLYFRNNNNNNTTTSTTTNSNNTNSNEDSQQQSNFINYVIKESSTTASTQDVEMTDAAIPPQTATTDATEEPTDSPNTPTIRLKPGRKGRGGRKSRGYSRTSQENSEHTGAPIERVIKKKSLYTVLTRLLSNLKSKDIWGLFFHPVDVFEVPDYLNVIKKPMDFSTMEIRLNRRDYKTLEEFADDFKLIVNNAQTYNAPETIFYKSAEKLKNYGLKLIEREAPTIDMSLDDSQPSQVKIQLQKQQQFIPPSPSPQTPAPAIDDKTKRKYARTKIRAHTETFRSALFHGDGTQIVNDPPEQFWKEVGFINKYENVLHLYQTDFHKTFEVYEEDEFKPELFEYGNYPKLLNDTKQIKPSTDSNLSYLLYGDELGEAYINSILEFVKDADPRLQAFVEKRLDHITNGAYSITRKVQEHLSTPVAALPLPSSPKKVKNTISMTPTVATTTPEVATTTGSTSASSSVLDVQPTSTTNVDYSVNPNTETNGNEEKTMAKEDDNMNVDNKEETVVLSEGPINEKENEAQEMNNTVKKEMKTVKEEEFDVLRHLNELKSQAMRMMENTEIEVWKKEVVDIAPLLTPVSSALDPNFTKTLSQTDTDTIMKDNLADVNELNTIKATKLEKRNCDLYDQEKIVGERIRRRLLNLVQRAPAKEFTAKSVPASLHAMYRSMQATPSRMKHMPAPFPKSMKVSSKSGVISPFATLSKTLSDSNYINTMATPSKQIITNTTGTNKVIATSSQDDMPSTETSKSSVAQSQDIYNSRTDTNGTNSNEANSYKDTVSTVILTTSATAADTTLASLPKENNTTSSKSTVNITDTLSATATDVIIPPKENYSISSQSTENITDSTRNDSIINTIETNIKSNPTLVCDDNLTENNKDATNASTDVVTPTIEQQD